MKIITSYPKGSEIHTIYYANDGKYYHDYYDKNPYSVNCGHDVVRDWGSEVQIYLDLYAAIEEILDEKLGIKE